jgi:hypothetical protein
MAECATLSRRERCSLAAILLLRLLLFYFHNTHQVLVGLPQGVDGLVILVYSYTTHQMLVGLPQGDSGLVLYFICSVFNSFYIIFVYFLL